MKPATLTGILFVVVITAANAQKFSLLPQLVLRIPEHQLSTMTAPPFHPLVRK